MQADIIVLRHSSAGAAETLARGVKSSVINAGDGWHEHPTQALLDLYTIRERGMAFAGLRVAIVGDVAHSRVARSNIYALDKARRRSSRRRTADDDARWSRAARRARCTTISMRRCEECRSS